MITSGPIVESLIFLDTFPDGQAAGQVGRRFAGWVVWWRTKNSATSDQTELGLAGLSLAK